MMGMGFGGNLMFDLFPIIFITIFVIVIGTFVVTAVRGVSQWHKNNESPELTVEAEVVTKRTDVSYHNHHSAGEHHHTHTTSSTTYYATFQVESGDRLEFALSGMEYGRLVEGDKGRLTFQGTRYKGFQRL